jgi:Na+/phosphate symporter
VKAIEAADNAVDQLYEAIKLYLVKVSRNELGEEESQRYVDTLVSRSAATSAIGATVMAQIAIQ